MVPNVPDPMETIQEFPQSPHPELRASYRLSLGIDQRAEPKKARGGRGLLQ